MTSIQKLNFPFRIYLVLFALISAFSFYLIWHHYSLINGNYGFGSFCSINQTFDCDVVNTSKYAVFVGVPVATWAFAYGILGLLISIVALRNDYLKMFGVNFLFFLSALAAMTSLVMLGLSAFAINKFCLLCSLLQIANLGTFLYIACTAKPFLKVASIWSLYSRKSFSFLTIGFGVLLLTHALTSQLKKEIEFNEEIFVQEVRSAPILPIEDASDSPKAGLQNGKAKLVMIEFFDYQCPACGFAARQMHRLAKAYGDKITVIYKHYPLDPSCNPNTPNARHLKACLAAKSAVCAHQQGKFGWMHEKLFSNQAHISLENILTWSKEGEFDLQAFQACLNEKKTAERVLQDIEQAMSLGLDSTPTFFINGRKVVGPITERKLELLLQVLNGK